MNDQVKKLCEQLLAQSNSIANDRITELVHIANVVKSQLDKHGNAHLIYVCTHNSRRSHLGQIWSSVAALWFGFENIASYSAGTEATAFHTNAMQAIENQGFQIRKKDEGNNPIVEVSFGTEKSVICFSKTIFDESLPKRNFIALMTCSDADENCPFLPGADARIPLRYEDPKRYDDTPLQSAKYMERSEQIGRELLYLYATLSDLTK